MFLNHCLFQLLYEAGFRMHLVHTNFSLFLITGTQIHRLKGQCDEISPLPRNFMCFNQSERATYSNADFFHTRLRFRGDIRITKNLSCIIESG